MNHRRWLRLAIGAAALSGTIGVAAPAAHAVAVPPSDYTWSGAGSDSLFSTAANWQGSAAPSNPAGTLIFPNLAQGGPLAPVDDYGPSGAASTSPLTAAQLSFRAGTYSGNQYVITGDNGKNSDPLTLDGLTGSSATPIGLTSSGGAQLALPVRLGATQEWDITGGTFDLSPSNWDYNSSTLTTATNPSYGSVVGGPSSSSLTYGLTVNLNAPPYGALFNLENTSIETSSFSATGGDTTQTGANAYQNGTITLDDIPGSNLPAPDLNGTSGNPVTITALDFTGTGKVGALKSVGAYVTAQNADPAASAGGGVLATTSATFDSASQLALSFQGPASGTTATAGTDNSELTSTGTVNLGGAALTFFGQTHQDATDPAKYDCNADLTPGTSYTLVSATSVQGQLSDGNGNLIPSGGAYSADCGTGVTADLRIDYTATSVTATVVNTTTTSLATSSATPYYGDTETLTATVTPASASGTVAFTQAAPKSSPTTIAGCGSVPVTNGQAVCQTSYGAGGGNYQTAYAVTADFTGSGASGSSSSPPQTVTPQGYKTTTTLTAQPSSVAVGQPVTLTATVVGTNLTPTGAVGFGYGTGQSGDAISGCESQTLTPSASQANTATATCTWMPDQSQIQNAAANYGGDATTQAAPSGAFVPFTPAPIAGAASSDAAQASNGTASAFDPDSNVTATATGGSGTVISSAYTADPVAPPTGFAAAGSYFDVRLSSGSTFTSLTISDAALPAGDSFYWYDPANGWTPVQSAAGQPYATLRATGTSPTLSQLTGTVFAVGGPVAVAPADGYRMVASDGGVFDYQRPFLGSTGNLKLVSPVVGEADAAGGSGYYTVAADGGVFAFGAPFAGSVPSAKITLSAPVVGMAVDKATGGYWLVGSDGNVYAFNAPGDGNLAGRKLSAPIVGIAATPSGDGYYLVGKDGGVFTFGAATFSGSTGALTLAKPIVGMAVNPAGGYWLVGADGGVFAFGTAFHGSAGGLHLNAPVIGMAADPAGTGYWVVGADGGVFSYGVPFLGSTGAIKLNKPIVAVAS